MDEADRQDAEARRAIRGRRSRHYIIASDDEWDAQGELLWRWYAAPPRVFG